MAYLDTVIIFTGQHQLLASFYQTGLDLPEPEPFGDTHLGIQLEGLYLGFDQVEGLNEPSTGGVSLWFGVPDLDASFAKLVDQGAEVRYPPEEKPFGDRVASVYDPDGNVIGLVQRDQAGLVQES
jgi:predicted enzyme related to lactoylglutathione lyase